jgi:hypothetical protein
VGVRRRVGGQLTDGVETMDFRDVKVRTHGVTVREKAF